MVEPNYSLIAIKILASPLLFFAKKQIDKDYRVAGLMKKLGYSNLTSSFDSIYIHSLVTLSVELEKPTLIKLFALPEVVNGFRDETYENDKGAFLRIVEANFNNNPEVEELKIYVSDFRIIHSDIKRFQKEFEKNKNYSRTPSELELHNKMLSMHQQICELKENEYKRSFEYQSLQYMEFLQKEFENKFFYNGVNQYVPLAGNHDEDPSATIDCNYEECDPVDPCITRWLNNVDKKFLLVLGEYGTGKTTLVQYLGAELSKNIIQNDIDVGSRNIDDPLQRIPLVLPLRIVKSQEMSDFITSYLMNTCGISINYQEFLRRFDNGEFIVIFDGFDEMAQKIDIGEKRKTLHKIAELYERDSKSKIILTSREEYFKTKDELMDVFKNISKFDIVHIPTFSDEKIVTYLKTRVADYADYWTKITDTFELHDLASRPVLLELIIRYLPDILEDIKPGRPIVASSLYEKCIIDEIRRKNDELSLSITAESRVALLEKLAVWLFCNGNILNIDVGVLAEELKLESFFETKQRWEIEKYLNEFLTFSFLLKESDNIFRISHKSFRDYLVAKSFHNEIENEAILDFGKVQTTPEINSLIIEQNVRGDHLFDIIFSTRKERLSQMWLGTNSANILLGIDTSCFQGRDLSGCQLGNVDFQNCDLSNTNLSKCNLRKCKFSNTILENANLKYSDLTGASFLELSKVNILSVSPNGKLLASAGTDSQITIWDISDLRRTKEVFTLSGHRQTIWALCFSNNGEFLYSAGAEGDIFKWDLGKRKYQKFDDCCDYIYSLAISKDDKILISGSQDHFITLWDAITGEVIDRIEGHSKAVMSVRIDPKNNFFISCGWDKKIKIWDFELKLLDEFTEDSHVRDVDITPDGEFILSGCYNHSIKLWSISERTYAEKPLVNDSIVYCVAASPDNKWLFSGEQDGVVSVSFKDKFTSYLPPLIGHSASVNSIVVSPDGLKMFSSGDDATIAIWDNSNRYPKHLDTVGQKTRCNKMQIAHCLGLDEETEITSQKSIAITDVIYNGTLEYWLIDRGATNYCFEDLEEYLLICSKSIEEIEEGSDIPLKPFRKLYSFDKETLYESLQEISKEPLLSSSKLVLKLLYSN